MMIFSRCVTNCISIVLDIVQCPTSHVLVVLYSSSNCQYINRYW